MKKKIIFFVFFFLSSVFFALDVPRLSTPISDYANLLKNTEREELTNFLRNVDENSKIQVALLTINSLEGNSIEDYSIKVAEEWKLGDAKENSGAILIISKEDRKMRIEVGYGLEKDLTDAVCSQIITNIIAPSFKKGEYYKGISDGLVAIVGYAKKDEDLIKNSNKNSIEEEQNFFSNLWKILGGLFIMYIFVSRKMRNPFWILFWFSNFFGYDKKYRGRNRYSNWTPFDYGSGSLWEGGFSSDDRDDFSGNGGKFGGGGASGGW